MLGRPPATPAPDLSLRCPGRDLHQHRGGCSGLRCRKLRARRTKAPSSFSSGKRDFHSTTTAAHVLRRRPCAGPGTWCREGSHVYT